ncbi:MAG: hypothetical protein IT368_11625, partial [Candidatus Hydrogenedentes bacterium]|nr:hypothetical protein [Candidatus Hydrogenedentota bacterium]
SYGLLLAYRPGPAARRRMGYAFAALFTAFFVDGQFGFNLRVPVSAAMLFLMIGALEGMWLPDGANATRGRSARAARLAWHLPLAAASVFFVLLQTVVFYSEVELLRGMRAQYRGQWAEARSALESGWRVAPWNWEFPRRLGQVHMAEADFAGAEELLSQAQQLNPYYVMTYVPLAHTRMADAQQRVAQHPDQPRPALEKLLLASDAANAALRLAPMLPAAEDILGRIASMTAVTLSAAGGEAQHDQVLQQWQLAEEYLIRALQHGASNQGDLYLMVAKVRVARGENACAEDALVHAVQADPDNQGTWQFFYDFATSNKRYDLLNHELQQQIARLEAQPGGNEQALATSYLWLAKVLEHGFGDLRGADDAYLSAVEFGALRPEVWANLAFYAGERRREGLLRQALRSSDERAESTAGEALGYIAGLGKVLRDGQPALEDASTQLLTAFKGYREKADMPLTIALGWAARLLMEETERAAAQPGSTPPA